MRNLQDRRLFEKYRIEQNVRSTGDFELRARSWLRLARTWKQEFFKRSSIKERWNAWRLGFEVGSYRAYQLDKNDYRNYVPDFSYTYHATKINGFFNPIIGNKLVVSNMLVGFGIPCAPSIGQIVRGRAHTFPDRDLTSRGVSGAIHSTDANLESIIRDWTDAHGKLVFRPHWSGGGEGVFFLDRHEQNWRINGLVCDAKDVLAIVASLDRYLVTQWVQQAQYSSRIFPDTSNTVRILTIRDSQGPYIAGAVHRFGSSRSYPVDNFHQGRGGLSVQIELATGVMGKAVTVNSSGEMELISDHPETGSSIEGVAIPHYETMTNALLKICEFMPESLLVGWDVLITDEGFCVIEANSPPGLVVWQVHQPLLANPRNARFFRYHGIPVAKHLLVDWI